MAFSAGPTCLVDFVDYPFYLLDLLLTCGLIFLHGELCVTPRLVLAWVENPWALKYTQGDKVFQKNKNLFKTEFMRTTDKFFHRRQNI
ncbi:MAG: hypothetical protein ACRC7H_07485 [Plesiomonas shigelloides]